MAPVLRIGERMLRENLPDKNRILILGAAGFIGTNLTLRLLLQGKRLVLFDRPGVSYPQEVVDAVENGQADTVFGSFAAARTGKWRERADSGEAVKGLAYWQETLPMLEEVDTVYHLISTTCPTNSNRDVAAEMEENLIATVLFLDACVQAGVKKVVFLSSGGTVYGKNHTGICREEEEAFPITSYGVQKLAIEKMLYLYYEMHGLDYRIVRLSNPYGPFQRPNGVQGVVAAFTWRALAGEPIEVYGDGSVVRDYIYIEDAVEGILKIAEGKGRHRLYNLGCGEGHTVLDVIAAIAEVLGKAPEVIYKPGRTVDVPVNVLDVRRFEQDFGSGPRLSLQEGIGRLAAFYRGGGGFLENNRKLQGKADSAQ